MKDGFGREISYLRISITEKCNLHCTYCMGGSDPSCLAKGSGRELTLSEIREVAAAAANLGIHKIRITGGEPLVRPDVVEICQAIHEIPGISELTLTTNGVFLEKYAHSLKQAGVNRVNISLDTLKGEKYRQITNRGDIQSVFGGIRSAVKEGLLPIKLNVVLMKGFTEEEICPFVELTRREAIEVRFIELMPMGSGAEPDKFLPGEAVLAAVPELAPVEMRQETTDRGVALLYRLPDALGKVGLIRPVSRHFCPSCNRIRLTSDGYLKPCLHSAQELDIKGLSGIKLEQALCEAISQKPMGHEDFQAGAQSLAGRRMNRIGG